MLNYSAQSFLPAWGVRNVSGEEQGPGAKDLTHPREKGDVEQEQVGAEHMGTAELGNRRINEFYCFSLYPAPAIPCNHPKHPPEQTPLALRPDLGYLLPKSEKLSPQKAGTSLPAFRATCSSLGALRCPRP